MIRSSKSQVAALAAFAASMLLIGACSSDAPAAGETETPAETSVVTTEAPADTTADATEAPADTIAETSDAPADTTAETTEE